MNDRKAFAGGMALLGVTFGREVDRPRIRAYWLALSDLEDAEFQLAVAKLCAGWKSSPAEMFPLPATIRAYARPYVDPAAAAVRLFDQVQRLGDYLPTGTRWSMAKIGQQLGWAAAEAFSAAGGSSAFANLTERDLPFVRKAFVDAYLRAADAASKRLAPPVQERPALPSDSPAVLALTAGIGRPMDFKARAAGEGGE